MEEPDKKYPLSVLSDLRASTLHFMSDKIYFDGVEYIRKGALLEWLNKAIIAVNNDGIRAGLKIVLTKIESI